MTLDDRLREILGEAYAILTTEECIAQIKQCFLEEGWVQTSKAVVNGEEVMYVDRKLMTGAEWYDRFIKAIDLKGNVAISIANILEAARKAAQL